VLEKISSVYKPGTVARKSTDELLSSRLLNLLARVHVIMPTQATNKKFGRAQLYNKLTTIFHREDSNRGENTTSQ
jgi:hypothetical protein